MTTENSLKKHSKQCNTDKKRSDGCRKDSSEFQRMTGTRGLGRLDEVMKPGGGTNDMNSFAFQIL